MKAIIKGFINLGNVFLAVGTGIIWFLPKLIEDGLLISLLFSTIVAILYLLYCSLTANRANEYLNWKSCRIDIMGDVIRHSFYIVYPIVWGGVIRHHFSLPITKEQYFAILVFLVLMLTISLWELAITVKNCLIAMERTNPITVIPS